MRKMNKYQVKLDDVKPEEIGMLRYRWSDLDMITYNFTREEHTRLVVPKNWNLWLSYAQISFNGQNQQGRICCRNKQERELPSLLDQSNFLLGKMFGIKRKEPKTTRFYGSNVVLELDDERNKQLDDDLKYALKSCYDLRHENLTDLTDQGIFFANFQHSDVYLMKLSRVLKLNGYKTNIQQLVYEGVPEEALWDVGLSLDRMLLTKE